MDLPPPKLTQSYQTEHDSAYQSKVIELCLSSEVNHQAAYACIAQKFEISCKFQLMMLDLEAAVAAGGGLPRLKVAEKKLLTQQDEIDKLKERLTAQKHRADSEKRKREKVERDLQEVTNDRDVEKGNAETAERKEQEKEAELKDLQKEIKRLEGYMKTGGYQELLDKNKKLAKDNRELRKQLQELETK